MQGDTDSSISLRSAMWIVASKDLDAWLRMRRTELKAFVTCNQTDEEEDENENVCEGTAEIYSCN
jgi:hypothetical protein